MVYNTRFGIEIEFTGLTRRLAAKVVAGTIGGEAEHIGTGYDAYEIKALDGRKWKVMRDASIVCQTRQNGEVRSASDLHSCELVSPVLTYREDIETLQQIIRNLRKVGGFANTSCGIHIHLDGANHTARTIRNFVNIIYSRNDLFYRALAINPTRVRYCKKLEERLVNELNEKKPTTLSQIEDIWYAGYWGTRNQHYHDSRYHFLNLHSFFHGHHTVELRGFNGTMHAGEIRSYIAFALALNHQALSQTCASTRKPQAENEKFAMRTYLNRIGLIGDEFKACREHLTKNLTGSAAWRHGRTA